ncbi:DUF1292 domain-containing protein [Clostridium sp. MSJ-11]|uniref:DUF1292 domain-containing protein n=1 Tax=Clostridium mobile TaxID=2841512 RepID=A0ABS6EDZ1_9CLOT|nr:DUF1292 domain-containing protein [Clostridium mobile]MBU5483413.1 DUF1292 domain-containing protein [Clostridium mobile]
MSVKSYSFRDEDGNLVKYNVKEFLSVNKKDYVVMSPENNISNLEVYKFSMQDGNECLELVDNEQELSQVKSVSKLI